MAVYVIEVKKVYRIESDSPDDVLDLVEKAELYAKSAGGQMPEWATVELENAEIIGVGL